MLALSEATSPNESVLDRLARLEADNQKLAAHNTHLTERNTLLSEEVRWLKAQLFGRSSEKSAAEVLARPEHAVQ